MLFAGTVCTPERAYLVQDHHGDFRVWVRNLDMLACTKAVRAGSDAVIRDGSGKRRPEAAVEGTCEFLRSNHSRCSND